MARQASSVCLSVVSSSSANTILEQPACTSRSATALPSPSDRQLIRLSLHRSLVLDAAPTTNATPSNGAISCKLGMQALDIIYVEIITGIWNGPNALLHKLRRS